MLVDEFLKSLVVILAVIFVAGIVVRLPYPVCVVILDMLVVVVAFTVVVVLVASGLSVFGVDVAMVTGVGVVLVVVTEMSKTWDCQLDVVYHTELSFLTHSLTHQFEAVPNSKKLQTTTEMWLFKDFKIQIA